MILSNKVEFWRSRPCVTPHGHLCRRWGQWGCNVRVLMSLQLVFFPQPYPIAKVGTFWKVFCLCVYLCVCDVLCVHTFHTKYLLCGGVCVCMGVCVRDGHYDTDFLRYWRSNIKDLIENWEILTLLFRSAKFMPQNVFHMSIWSSKIIR